MAADTSTYELLPYSECHPSFSAPARLCPAQEVEVKTEAECMEVCTHDDTRWGYEGEDKDVCAETYIPYVECLAMLPCDELQTHFSVANEVPTEQRSSCGGDLRAQLDCQLPYQ